MIAWPAQARDHSEPGRLGEYAGAILLRGRSRSLGMTAVSDQPEHSRVAVAPDLLRRHAETVYAAIAGEADGLEVEAISHSWRRSAEIFQVDAESRETPHILTESAVRLSKEPMEGVVRAAQPELDQLHRIVRHAGYATLLCDTDGVMRWTLVAADRALRRAADPHCFEFGVCGSEPLLAQLSRPGGAHTQPFRRAHR